MRKASSNWLGKTVMSVLFGVLIISFGVWGIADIFKGFGQSSLAKIGSTEITTEQFRNLFTDKVQQIGRRFGRPLTMEQARQFGLDRQVLQEVISDAALDETARRMGLGQLRQTGSRSGGNHRAALTRSAGGVFRRAQATVQGAGISQDCGARSDARRTRQVDHRI